MKKILLTIISALFGTAILVTPVLAATTVSFSPPTVDTVQGEVFSVVVAISPQGVKSYTAKIELDYPADLLEVKSFSFASGWMPLTQSGYDLIDNTNGVLVKTAGYPGGVSSAVTFGTVSFLTKKTGSGSIKLGNGALVLDADNENVLSGSATVAFGITVPLAPVEVVQPVKPTPPVTRSQTPPKAAVVATTPLVKPAEEPAVAGAATTTEPLEEAVVPTNVATPQAPQKEVPAAQNSVGNILTLGTGSPWIGIPVGLAILALIVYAVNFFIRRRRGDSN